MNGGGLGSGKFANAISNGMEIASGLGKMMLNEKPDNGYTFVDPDGYKSGQFAKPAPTLQRTIDMTRTIANLAAKGDRATTPYDMNAVDPTYIAAVINPEDNMSR